MQFFVLYNFPYWSYHNILNIGAAPKWRRWWRWQLDKCTNPSHRDKECRRSDKKTLVNVCRSQRRNRGAHHHVPVSKFLLAGCGSERWSRRCSGTCRETINVSCHCLPGSNAGQLSRDNPQSYPMTSSLKETTRWNSRLLPHYDNNKHNILYFITYLLTDVIVNVKGGILQQT